MAINDMVRAALLLAQQGVDYTKRGAYCPLCGQKMRTVDTKDCGKSKLRWHKCRNEDCLLGSMALLVKSAQQQERGA